MTDETMEIDINAIKCEVLRKILGTLESIDIMVPIVRNYYEIYKTSAPAGSKSSVSREIDVKLDDIQTNTNRLENDTKTLLSSLGCKSTF